MDFFEITGYAHPADEVYEGQPAQVGKVEVNPHVHLTGSMTGVVITLLPIAIVAVLLYLVLVRPQRRSDKSMKRMLDSIEIGDEVVTVGGICGKVIDLDDKYIFIEIGVIGNVEGKPFLKVERDAIKAVEHFD